MATVAAATPIGTTTGTAAAAANSALEKTKSAGFGADFDSFLTLLTAQLKNQDPTKAMDTTEMTNQLVAFAGVEQQIKMNGSLEDLIALQQTGQLTAAAPLLGRTVEVASDKLALQDGNAILRLPAAGRATEAVLKIQDAAGRTVREATLKLNAAPGDLVWDGRDQQGKQLADGVFRFTLDGRDVNGNAAPVTATVVGRATGVERDGANSLKLLLGKLEVGFDQVQSVRPN